ncbi:hypothetical protein HanRHA438_Chr06g0272701 [Helianthus annuus]|nr:hypothetical protein HanRHA438_Chr06g0272701 [Helianthus annuus]
MWVGVLKKRHRFRNGMGSVRIEFRVVTAFRSGRVSDWNGVGSDRISGQRGFPHWMSFTSGRVLARDEFCFVLISFFGFVSDRFCFFWVFFLFRFGRFGFLFRFHQFFRFRFFLFRIGQFFQFRFGSVLFFSGFFFHFGQFRFFVSFSSVFSVSFFFLFRLVLCFVWWVSVRFQFFVSFWSLSFLFGLGFLFRFGRLFCFDFLFHFDRVLFGFVADWFQSFEFFFCFVCSVSGFLFRFGRFFWFAFDFFFFFVSCWSVSVSIFLFRFGCFHFCLVSVFFVSIWLLSFLFGLGIFFVSFWLVFPVSFWFGVLTFSSFCIVLVWSVSIFLFRSGRFRFLYRHKQKV